jgi:hypothetical protein
MVRALASQLSPSPSYDEKVENVRAEQFLLTRSFAFGDLVHHLEVPRFHNLEVLDRAL